MAGNKQELGSINPTSEYAVHLDLGKGFPNQTDMLSTPPLFDYTKLKVSELKAMAEQKGLEGYKSLKKSPLIELLKSSE